MLPAMLLWMPPAFAQSNTDEGGGPPLVQWAFAGVLAAAVLAIGGWALRRRPPLVAEKTALGSGDGIGPYTLTKFIGEGGVGGVFQARDLDGNAVAVKILHPHLAADSGAVEAFHAEAAVGGQLDSADVVRTLDFGESPQGHFIALEWVDGVDLHRLLEHCRALGEELSEAAVVHLGLTLARALGYAHGGDRQWIHRDLSPSNLLVSRRGKAKLGDFGAAEKSAKENADEAVFDKSFRGKLGYMSPEQARGEPLDGRSDLYAVGLLLFELLTLSPANRRESDAETLTLLLDGDVARLETLRPHLSQLWQPLVDDLLAKTRQERLASAVELERRLIEIEDALAADDEAAGRKQLGALVEQVLA